MKLKPILKKIPIPVLCSRFLRRLLSPIFRFPFAILQYTLKNSWWARSLFFEASDNRLLIANVDETFIVSSQDLGVGRQIFVTGSYDFDKFLIARDLGKIETSDTVLVDVGANIGSICIPLVKRGLISAAIAIEPEPFNFRLLKSNIALNDLEENITALNTALGAKNNESLHFEISDDNFGDHRIFSRNCAGIYNENKRTKITVNSTTLDSITSNCIEKDLFLWMDVQGYEGYVLYGGRKTIQKGFPMILEFWPYGMKRVGSFKYLKNSLRDSPYSLFFDLKNEEKNAVELSNDNLDRLYEQIGEGGRSTDIFLLA